MASLIMSVEITYEPHLSKEDEETIFGGLLEHASLETGLPIEKVRSKPFAFVVRINDVIQAGLMGNTFCQAAQMETLWVDRLLRKQGIGRALLKKAEKYAKGLGCTTAYLNTLSPDNLRFYENSGYVFEFSRQKYLGEFTMHYFKKHL